MHHQRVLNPKLKGLRGVAVMLGILGLVAVDWFVFEVAIQFLSYIPCLLIFYGVGIVIALFALRRYVLGYSYILTGTVLRLSHCYGKHERMITDIYLNTILNVGTEEEIRERYPKAKLLRARLTRLPDKVTAVAFREDKKVTIALLQPDEKIEKYLKSSAEKNRKK